MNVYFWATFVKRRNSTKQPTGGTLYDCVLKDNCSSMQPKIALKWDGPNSPVSFTYAYIPAFQRYYFINNWTFEDRQWIATMEEDVLATYKTEIGLLYKYVIRTGDAAVAAGTPDALFPAGFTHDDGCVEATIPGWTTQPSTGGSYVVGIVGNDNANFLQVGGAAYCVMDATNLNKLITAAYTNLNDMWTGYAPTTVEDALGTVFQNLLKSVTNPSEFLSTALWFPFSVPASAGMHYPSLGPLMQTAAHAYGLAYPVDTIRIFLPTGSIFGGTAGALDKHLYIEPYAAYYLEFWPFGIFPINGRTLVSNDTRGIQIDLRIDYVTGTARFEAYISTAGELNANAYRNAYLCGGSAKLGVELPLAGAKSNYAGGLGSLLSTIGAAASASSGWGVAGALASGAVNTAQAIAPTASSGGSCTGFAGISNVVRLHKTRFVATTDYPDLGKSYAQRVYINTLSGYVQCWDGECEIYGSIAERDEIASFLTGGFFYE